MANGFSQVNAVWQQEGDAFACSEATPFAPGQIGVVAAIDNSTGLDPGNSPKLVQYVKRRSTDALTLTSGQAVYWADLDNYLVTDTQSAAIGGTVQPVIAGFVQSSNPQPGSHGFIQVGGQGLVRVSDSTAASTTGQGRPLVVVANQTFGYVTSATATDATTLLAFNVNRPVVGVLTVGNNATTTSLTCEALIAVTRHGW